MRARGARKRMRAGWDAASELGAGLWLGAVLLVLACLLLMLVGLGVRELSVLLGRPLPSVDRDPDRIEWGGLALLVAYGCGGTGVLLVCWEVVRRRLGGSARAAAGRAIGATLLLAVAVVSGWLAVENWDLTAGGLSLSAAFATTRVARGLPIDDEDDHETELPASFDTPVELVDEDPAPRVEVWTPPPRRPFAPR